MSAGEQQEEVRKVLDHLDATLSDSVNQNMQLICKLMNELSVRFKEEKGILRGTRIRVSGGAYQKLAMKTEADFNLILELAEPFVSSTYKITRNFGTKDVYYKLKARERETAAEGKTNMAESKETCKVFYSKKKDKITSTRERYENVFYRKKKNKLTNSGKIDMEKTFKGKKIAFTRKIDKKTFRIRWIARTGKIDMKRTFKMNKVNSTGKINRRNIFYRKVMREMARSGELSTVVVNGRTRSQTPGTRVINTDMFYSKKKNLKTQELRNRVYSRLTQILSNITLGDAWVTCSSKSLALQLVLHTSHGRQLKLAITPEIIVRSWEECPGLVAQRTLPQCLQDYIATRAATGSAVLYIIPALPHSVHSVPEDICCMVDCLMLENQFLMKLRDIFDMVRLANLVKDYMDWTVKFGLKSFHLKRVAIKNAARLRNMATWDGFKALLQYLGDEVQQGGVKDCFVQDHVIFRLRNPSKLERFQCDLREVQQWKPKSLAAMVRQRSL